MRLDLLRKYRWDITQWNSGDVELMGKVNIKEALDWYNEHMVNKSFVYHPEGGTKDDLFPIIPQKYVSQKGQVVPVIIVDGINKIEKKMLAEDIFFEEEIEPWFNNEQLVYADYFNPETQKWEWKKN